MKYTNAGKIHFVLFILSLLLFITCKKESPIDKGNWELTFNEEFSDSILNRNTWKTLWPAGQSASDGLHLYSDSAFLIKDGILHIQIKRDTLTGVVYDENYHYFQKLYYFTSGMLQSSASFSQQYGYFEIRSKVPYGMGFWPAFWLMANSGWPPEIDVFEILGKEPNRLHMTNHFKDKNGEHRQNSFTLNGPDFSNDFHTFAIEWNPKEIIWYLDNEQVFKSEVGIPNERMYLILTVGLGAGGFPGAVDNTTPFPNSFDIDYVRVYRKK